MFTLSRNSVRLDNLFRLDKGAEEFQPVFYMRYVDDIFVLFRKEEHLKLFLNYFNTCHENINKFNSDKETNK